MATQSANEGDKPTNVTAHGHQDRQQVSYEEARAELDRYYRSEAFKALPKFAQQRVREEAEARLTQKKEEDVENLWRATLAEGGIRPADDPMFSLDAPEVQQYDVGDPMEAAKAAWLGGGDSQFGGLEYDAGALGGMRGAEDYYSNLVKGGGRDAQSEAEYARRVEQSERARRGESDAAVRSLETQGRGGSGATLLAGLMAGQGQANDQYQAGLDANAMAQGRRDNAAAAGADIARMRGDAQFGADQAQASGMDAWAQWNATSDWNARNVDADRQQSANTANYNRQNSVSDANTDAANDRAWWEGPGKAQELWNRQQQSLAGATGQVNLSISNEREDHATARNNRQSPTEIIGGAADTGAKTYATYKGLR